MSRESMEKLLDALKLLRSGKTSRNEVQSQLKALAEQLSDELSPGLRLKIGRGSMADLMRVASQVVPACQRCAGLCKTGLFSSRADHETCARVIDGAVANGYLARRPRPEWIGNDPTQLGADAYFTCVTCGSLWTLVEPERHTKGLWERLA